MAIVEIRVIAVQLLALVAAGLIAQKQIGAPLGSLLPVILSLACAILFSTGDRTATARRALLATLAALGLLWAIALYAPEVGEKAARNAVAGLNRSPDVVLYSKERMSIAGLGVEVTELPQKESAFLFRYSGLRMLIYTNERYFLLPATWQKGRESVYIVRDNDDVRVDVQTAPD